MKNHSISAVLFDLDGVLIDSPHIHVDSWVQVFRPYGIEIPPRELHINEGRKSLDIARRIVREYNLQLEDNTLIALIERKREIYRENAPRGMRHDAQIAVTGVKKLGWKVGLVSGSVIENVLMALSSDEQILFDTMVTAGDYKYGKPHPEPFLTACKNLAAEPQNCIAVENAPLGIKSAKSAGLKVIALTSTLSASELKQADQIVSDLTILPSLVGEVSTGRTTIP